MAVTGVEGRGLALRCFLHAAEEFGGRGLVETRAALHAQDADRLQNPQRSQAVDVGGVLRG